MFFPHNKEAELWNKVNFYQKKFFSNNLHSVHGPRATIYDFVWNPLAPSYFDRYPCLSTFTYFENIFGAFIVLRKWWKFVITFFVILIHLFFHVVFILPFWLSGNRIFTQHKAIDPVYSKTKMFPLDSHWKWFIRFSHEKEWRWRKLRHSYCTSKCGAKFVWQFSFTTIII